MAALAGLDAVAHGGTAGLVAELSLGLVAAACVGWVWWQERRRVASAGRREAARMRDEPNDHPGG